MSTSAATRWICLHCLQFWMRSFFAGLPPCGENFRGNFLNAWRLGIGASNEQRRCLGLECLRSSFKGRYLNDLIGASVKWLANVVQYLSPNPTWAICSQHCQGLVTQDLVCGVQYTLLEWTDGVERWTNIFKVKLLISSGEFPRKLFSITVY